MKVEFPLDYSEAMIIIITGVIIVYIVRRSYTGLFRRLIDKIYQAADGDIDLRLETPRSDAVGDLAEAVDTLLTRRAAEIYQLRGLNEELRARESELDMVVGYGLKIVSCLEWGKIAEKSTEALCDLTGAKAGIVYIVEGEEDDIVPLVAGSVTGEGRFVGGVSIRYGQGLVGWALANCEAVISNNVEYDERNNQDGSLREGAGFFDFPVRSTLIAPVQANAAMIGAVQVVNKLEGFSPGDLSKVEALSDYIAVAIRNARAASGNGGTRIPHKRSRGRSTNH